MKIAMVGLGSIGQRHIINICHVLTNKKVLFCIDALRKTHKVLPDQIVSLINRQYTDIQQMPDDYDVVFITNPTAIHYDTLKSILAKTKHIFMEKPIFEHTAYRLEDLQLKDESVYYVACPLRYTKVMQYLKTFVDQRRIFSVRAICSTYLPDWRIDSDYRKTYSAHKNLGGGVSLDLIHEWDYLCYLFGFPEKIFHMQGKYSDLEISSEDLSLYIAKYPDKLVSLHLDYFGRSPRREIEIYYEEDVVIGDLIQQEIRFSKQNKCLNLFENRNEYQISELEYFFDILDGKAENHNDFKSALKTLSVAEGIV